MEHATQAVEARIERDHWWFRGRRRLVRALIRALETPPSAQVLDVGCGTGANLRLLAEIGFRDVMGMDCSQEAIEWCAQKGLPDVARGDLRDLPFPEAHFDLVLATDVLEHIEEEATAISELHRVLRPGGTLLVTVPAFESLWGLQDEVSHHVRRYRRDEIVAKLRAGGFRVTRSFYFNFLLFAPIWMARQLMRWLGVKLASENEVNTRWLNALLSAIFACDVWIAPRLRPAFGVSIFVVARRRDAV
ncbi:MAG: class I SAM-dependent methyltransferase [Myxococcales bacterium]|nr:class I SAM-dependent methyltransferase [Myxococcales bacterium]